VNRRTLGSLQARGHRFEALRTVMTRQSMKLAGPGARLKTIDRITKRKRVGISVWGHRAALLTASALTRRGQPLPGLPLVGALVV
jgi:hypothetical protein